jgi:hydrogenase nickel incorporation protein HypB
MGVDVIEMHRQVATEEVAAAVEVRARLADAGVLAFNLVSAPGAGKTTLLERTLRDLGRELGIGVIVGEVESSPDAERLTLARAQAVATVHTGGGCHLSAPQVLAALADVDLGAVRLLFIENVGSLTCAAGQDLGEAAKIVLLSAAQGEDQPVKYPQAFRTATHAVLNKIDLLPHLRFDPDRAVRNALALNPHLRFFFTSALTGQGLHGWYAFLRERVRRPPKANGES